MKFIDAVEISVQAGNGGAGALSFHRMPGRPNGPADGGDGGNGADVVLRGDHRLNTLLEFRFRPLHRAAHGGRGASANKTGKNAPTLVLPVPLGTIAQRVDEAGASEVIGEILSEGEELKIASGGRSGKGNARFVSSRRPRPDFVLEADSGESIRLRLELKLMADIGLLGLPNAGKSTLIRALSNARPKVADYPFTTKIPSLGVVRHHERDLVIADIPGLVAGASDGVGLGHQFLKHIERVSALAHLVTLPDYAQDQGVDDLIEAFETIERELNEYSAELAGRPRLAILSKTDLPHIKALEQPFAAWCAARSMPCVAISAATADGLNALLDALFSLAPVRGRAKPLEPAAFNPAD